MPNCRDRIVVCEGLDEADVVVREPAAELVFAGTGPARGEYEEAHPANDVEAQYIPPGRAA